MILNYLKIVWRNLVHRKIYTAINILGLALGLCTCMAIFVVVNYEFSFDTFHPDKKRIYRIVAEITESTGDKLDFVRISVPVAVDGRSKLTGIDVIAGIIPYYTKVSVPNGDKAPKRFQSSAAGLNYPTTVIAEPQYFSIFPYQWLAGNSSTALDAPFKVVLTESKAQQYFDGVALDKIVGKQLIYQDSLVLSVSGIVKDWHKNTDLSFTDFISFPTLESSFLKHRINSHSWAQQSMSAWVFTKLSEGTNPEKVQSQMKRLVKMPADAENKMTLKLESLADIHFNADIIENPIRTAHQPSLYSLMGIAVFILILAIINFINLSTAQSIQRAKEVGLRKVLGSNRLSLVFQFLTETFLLTFISVMLALFLVKPVLLVFQSFIPTGVVFHLFEPATLAFLALVTLFTAVFAGVYPAIVLSSYLPAISLKGLGAQKGGKKWLLRKGLIVFQFTVSLIFIIGGLVIADQLRYTREKDLGFTTDAIINIEPPGKIDVFTQRIKQIPGVEMVASQWLSPMHENARGMKLKFKSTDQKDFWVTQVVGNENYIPLYEIKLLAGRNLMPADSVKEFVINENLSRLMGHNRPEESLGKILYWNDQPYPVVGVAADFHTSSLHDPIAPLCIINRPDREWGMAIKLNSKGKQAGIIKSALVDIKKAWKHLYPAQTFTYHFYDESIAMLYEKDQQAATLMNVSMGIAIFISCIGLFGLTLYAAEKRAKEISIRKILGASVANISTLLSKDFVVLVIIALVIASPIAWYFAHQWLQGFAYHISIPVWVFVVTGAGALLITLLTVSYQSLRAALVNPVKSLKSE